jgi:hypothetical protein
MSMGQSYARRPVAVKGIPREPSSGLFVEVRLDCFGTHIVGSGGFISSPLWRRNAAVAPNKKGRGLGPPFGDALKSSLRI